MMTPDNHQNPPDSPLLENLPADAAASPEPPATPPTFYRVDLRKCTVAELRRGSKAWEFPLALLLYKVFRARLPVSIDDPVVGELAPFRVPELRLHESTRPKFDEFVEQLRALGFVSPIYHTINDAVQSTVTVLATFAHPTLSVAARVHLRLWTIKTPAPSETFVEFMTERSDGTFVWTVSSKRFVAAPEGAVALNVRAEMAPAELLEVHRKGMAAGSARWLPSATSEQAEAVGDKLHARMTEFHRGRGVFAPLTETDTARMASVYSAYHAAATQGALRNPLIVAEVNALLNKKSSWVTAVILLAVSLVLFVGIGLFGQRSWGMFLALVPILLFHELGHYLAMRVCGYRNLRMFFIPGFGAAVTGRAFNVAGWKKIVVSLMGPVPGIVLGIIVGLCGIVWNVPMVVNAGGMLVAINGFNLLPVLPLDGGHVVHTMLFTRSFGLDAAFRIVAALGLAAMGVFLPGGRVFLFVAFFMLMGLPASLRVARAARDVRAEGVDSTSPDNQSIPPQLADRIIDKLRGDASKPAHSKVLAQQTLQVYETLNTRPPGWLASIGLGTVHITSLLAAVVFMAVFVVAQQGGLRDFIRDAANAPKRTIKAPFATAGTFAPPMTSDSNAGLIVATFERSGKAQQEYTRIAANLGPKQRVLLFGDTLLLRGVEDPDARRMHLDTLQASGADAFVDGPQMGAYFRFQGIAPTEEAAKQLEDEINAYLHLPLSTPARLIAPWSTSVKINDRERRARATYLRLESVSAYDDPRMQELRKKIEAARRRGDGAAVKDLSKQETDLFETIMGYRRQKIAAENGPDADPELAARYIAIHGEAKPDALYETLIKEMGPRMGSAIAEDGFVRDPTCARSGWLSRRGLILRISGMSFERSDDGAVRVMEWLQSKGLNSLRYDVGGMARDEDGNED